MFSSMLLVHCLLVTHWTKSKNILVPKHVLGVFAIYTTSQILDIPEVNLFLAIPQNL